MKERRCCGTFCDCRDRGRREERDGEKPGERDGGGENEAEGASKKDHGEGKLGWTLVNNWTRLDYGRHGRIGRFSLGGRIERGRPLMGRIWMKNYLGLMRAPVFRYYLGFKVPLGASRPTNAGGGMIPWPFARL